jgi:hypothetical protein
VTRGLQVDVNEVWTLALLEAQHAPDVVLDAWEQAFGVSFLVRVAPLWPKERCRKRLIALAWLAEARNQKPAGREARAGNCFLFGRRREPASRIKPRVLGWLGLPAVESLMYSARLKSCFEIVNSRGPSCCSE